MKHGRLADFFFAGLGIAPVALMFGGLPQVAMLLFIPLMFVACCFGMAEQLEEKERPEGAADGAPPPRDAPGRTFRQREPRE
jgi:hypothetical protein